MQLDARLDTPGWAMPCCIPKLQSVLNAVPETLHWQLEVKSDSHKRLTILAKRLNEIISSNSMADRVTVTSSNRWFLRHIKRINPSVHTGYVAEFRQPDPVRTAVDLECKLLVLNEKLADTNRVKQAKESKLQVSCWTVNDIVRMQDLVNIGVDSIITDIPSAAIRHFQ